MTGRSTLPPLVPLLFGEWPEPYFKSQALTLFESIHDFNAVIRLLDINFLNMNDDVINNNNNNNICVALSACLVLRSGHKI